MNLENQLEIAIWITSTIKNGEGVIREIEVYMLTSFCSKVYMLKKKKDQLVSSR